MPKTKSKPTPPASICLCILAGGLSTRMGRDKSRVRLGNRTLLGHVKTAALATGSGHPVKIIRRDLVPRCGPLGGILTAFQKHRADLYLFLSCDAPFITPNWLKKLITTQKKTPTHANAVFTQLDGYASFPFILAAETLPLIEAQRQRGNYSLQTLARALKAKTLKPTARQATQFLNVNNPEALEEARSRYRGSSKNQAQSSNLNSR